MKGRYVALLRGINVGGKNLVAMSQLAAAFVDSGCRDVQTYIQSGNVVFTGDVKTAQKAVLAVAARWKVPVILRSQAELEGVANACPYADVDKAHVMFLADQPTAGQVAALDATRSAPDEFKVIGREIYLHMPNGMGRTKLTNAYFDSKLKTVSTVRNWRTVLKLLAMMAG